MAVSSFKCEILSMHPRFPKGQFHILSALRKKGPQIKGQGRNNVSMVFIGFSRDSWGLEPINTHYIGLI